MIWTKRAGLLQSVHRAGDQLLGAVLFPFSLVLCAAFYWPIDSRIFQGAALILGLSDGLAGLIGQRMGRRSYRLTGHKTIEGSLVFFAVTVVLLLGFSHSSPTPTNLASLPWLGGAAALLTVIEGSFGRGWDNLPVPLLGGLVLFLFIG